jgi:aerobic carbon-monoxide dehydrogenase medium subunit
LSGQPETRLYLAPTLDAAVAALVERGSAGAPLAGATWIMRAPLRREKHLSYVAIGRIAELREVSVGDRDVSIGACTTHAELARRFAGISDCQALALAAGNAANPAIREVATIGGNLCAANFPAADLVPALLCLNAEIELQGPQGGTDRIPLSRFLETRASLSPGQLVRRVIIARAPRRSVHVRLPLRKAGDYPVATFSLAVTLNTAGTVVSADAAVGSVEPMARRWPELEAELIGRPLDPAHAAQKAEHHSAALHGRDGVEAPGWYRVRVLPSLVRKAVSALREQS